MATTKIQKLYLRQESSFEYEVCIDNVPSGQTITSARFMVKAGLYDDDSAAVISKFITISAGADGQVTDDGSAGTGKVKFIIGNDDCDGLDTTKLYISAVKVYLSDGMDYQPP